MPDQASKLEDLKIANGSFEIASQLYIVSQCNGDSDPSAQMLGACTDFKFLIILIYKF